MDILSYVIIFLFIYIIATIIATLYRRWKLRKIMVYNPFALTVMFSRCECQECKSQFDKPFERFEYAYKEIEWACVDCKKVTKCLILGSFTIRIETPQEKKWKKFEERFR